ncbi:HprK-related kinase A [Parahaliea sp. F7430]|uniref:HprK-related kinase A n=1 Tax=Sediminihaliea albiluteola TaxID=2758564 RepID=A0A7W2TVI8_9GAMM|nr:HprK-related kinase A [Sediminihaliea albiluteola]MBA6412718.1 HprK-related kinase A [Sediminihaliea albiluteola]
MTSQTLASLDDTELSRYLEGSGLRFCVGPYTYALRSPLPIIRYGLARLYADHPLAANDGFADFHLSFRANGLLDFLRGHIHFQVDEQSPFAAIPKAQAYAFLEWGMNWCVSVTLHEYLKLHAAVVAKNGVAVVLPGLPGAGKSTLSAALALRGWRLLSDEHAMLEPGSNKLVPLPRPVSLKNDSIELIQAFEPSAIMGPVSEDTHKGSVAHLKADLASDSHDLARLPARFLVFPRYQAGAKLRLSPKGRAESFMFAAHHSFNYSLLGESGFDSMSRFIDNLECFDLHYGSIDQAHSAMESLLHGRYGA